MSDPAVFHDDPMMLIDAYLAGELSGDARAAFERRLAADPALRAELDAQTRFDAELKRAFAVPTAPLAAPAASGDVVGIVRPGVATGSRRGKSWLTWIAAAAVVAIAGGLTAYYTLTGNPGAVYDRAIADGFIPPIPCPNDPESFAVLVQRRLGTKLYPKVPPDLGLAMTGWGYGNSWGTPLNDQTLVLLATRGSDKIVVFIDKIENDRWLRSPGGGRYLHRRTTGNYVLYEISTVSEPLIIQRLDVQ